MQPHFSIIVATQDWHPKDHLSFASNQPGHAIGETIILNEIPQLLWPDHCIQNTKGAQLHPLLDMHRVSKIFFKGEDKEIDSYSAFFDNAHLRSTGLAAYLRHQGVGRVYMLGLATDYCVKYSALDAIQLGFEVYVIKDACRAVALQPDDAERAMAEMAAAGVHLILADEIGQSNA